MKLTPKLPPGRATRKALAFAAEIHRLRVAGYIFEAIRLSLRNAGVEVSNTTVKREAAKHVVVPPTVPSRPVEHTSAPPLVPVLQELPGDRHTPGTYLDDARSGKEIAEAFMRTCITNPLMQERSRHEDRCD